MPIPKDADLNLIRIEMLNQHWSVPGYMIVEYVWLDVLCLRQEGGEREDLRAGEWKVDVPTIGVLYSSPPTWSVVYYLSGLGRPLRFKPGDLEDERIGSTVPGPYRRSLIIRLLVGALTLT